MITAENVTVQFSKGRLGAKLKALDGFSLSVAEGEVLALLGPNGAGKSTAMYCFLGLIQPDSGSVTVGGERPEPGGTLFKDIAYLPEEPHYHEYLSVREAVTFYAALWGGLASSRQIDDAIERVGLTAHRDFRVAKCSKGMKQKVGIAQCLIRTPRILFLDEPTRGLDPTMVREFREIILELRRQGATIVVNTHVLSEIETVCTQVAIMNRGRVVRKGSLQDIRTVSNEVYAVDFSAIAELPPFLTVVGRDGDWIRGEVGVENLWVFLRMVERSGAHLRGCSLKQTTLEEAFLREVEKA